MKRKKTLPSLSLLSRSRESPQEQSRQGRQGSQTNPPTEQRRQNQDLRREINGNIRALEGEGNERSFELSFSSEEPYKRFFGIEILDHSPGAVDLTRLNEIGVLLFNHDRDEVLGRIERAWLEGDRGKAVVVFDSDDAAETIYQKVKSGTLKGVSVGYRVKTWERVTTGETSSSGKFTGPCDVAISWEPFEISIVSVPADPTVGVGRELETPEAVTPKGAPSLAQRKLRVNINRLL
jgi:HK97 family phage prohead protease